MNNLSDGKTDGVVITYMKDGIIYPVGLSKEQLEMLDISVGIALGGKILVMQDMLLGKAVIIK